MAIEDIEWAQRKSGAVLEMILGFVIFILAIPLPMLITGPSIPMTLILFFIGIMLFSHGRHVYNKVTHIVWTKQAIREYDDKKTAAKEVYNAVTSNFKCPNCGTLVNLDAKFCSQCASKVK